MEHSRTVSRTFLEYTHSKRSFLTHEFEDFELRIQVHNTQTCFLPKHAKDVSLLFSKRGAQRPIIELPEGRTTPCK